MQSILYIYGMVREKKIGKSGYGNKNLGRDVC